MSVKFSLGPWTAKPHRLMAAVPVIAGDGQLVATTSSGGTPDKTRRQTNIENARLIAAAPDMLLCLRNVIDSHGEVDQDLWNRIREVIANATGEAS
jgi:hypothetical protein